MAGLHTALRARRLLLPATADGGKDVGGLHAQVGVRGLALVFAPQLHDMAAKRLPREALARGRCRQLPLHCIPEGPHPRMRLSAHATQNHSGPCADCTGQQVAPELHHVDQIKELNVLVRHLLVGEVQAE